MLNCSVGTQRRFRRRVLSVTLAASCLVSAGCGASSDDQAGSAGSGVAAAIAFLSAHRATSRYLEYVNMAALRADGIVDDSAGSGEQVRSGWELVAGLGTGEFSNEVGGLRTTLGVDLYSVAAAVGVGERGKLSTYDFSGQFDAAAITAKLTRFGARPHQFGSARGMSSPPHVLTNKLAAQQVYVSNQLDNVVVTNTEFVASRDPDSVRAGVHVAAPSATDARLAACLGDVVGAAVLVLSKDPNSRLVAVGIRDPGTSGAPLHEVLCVAPAPGKDAAIRAAMTRAFRGDATDPANGSPISASVAAARVSETGGDVSAVLATRSPIAGYLLLGLDRGEAGYWDGSCPAAQAAEGRC